MIRIKTQRPSLGGLLVITWFHFRQLLRTSFFLQLAISAPISFALLRAIGSWGAGTPIPATLWFDVAVAGMWATTTTAMGIIGFQRFQGTLEFQALSVLSPGVVFGGLVAASALIGWIGLPIGILMQMLFTGSIEFTPTAALGYALASFGCVASASVLAGLFVVSRSAIAYEPLVLVPIWLLSGIVVPLELLPEVLRIPALLHPLSSAVLVGEQDGFLAAFPWVLLSLAVSAIWLVLATIILRVAIRRARIAGTLSLA